MDTLQFLADGFATAFQWHNLLFAFIGVLIGTAVGVLPGIGPMSGVALLIPVTASMTGGLPPEAAATSSIILLAGRLLRSHVRRVNDLHPAQYAGRILIGRDHAGRLSNG